MILIKCSARGCKVAVREQILSKRRASEAGMPAAPRSKMSRSCQVGLSPRCNTSSSVAPPQGPGLGWSWCWWRQTALSWKRENATTILLSPSAPPPPQNNNKQEDDDNPCRQTGVLPCTGRTGHVTVGHRRCVLTRGRPPGLCVHRPGDVCQRGHRRTP